MDKRNNIKRSPNNRQYRKKKKYKKRRLNKKRVFIALVILLTPVFLLIRGITKKINEKEIAKMEENKQIANIQSEEKIQLQEEKTKEEVKPKKEITDWRLQLVNSENILPEDFVPDVKDIDDIRQFDSRAIKELNQMMNDMKKDGITNVWIQSAYRSISRQKELYDKSVEKHMKQGKTKEEAIKLTEQYINKPGSSEHNLALAVDFNKVDNSFEKLKGFNWLQENAENYGFILRYPKEKEDITKIGYESWHWRYVGKENAIEINKLGMCLEEYIEYLEKK